MKMSIELYQNIDDAVFDLSQKTNLTDLKKKMIQAGNSETRFVMDVFYMIQGHSLFREEIDIENLNDEHIITAMKRICKKF